MPKEGPYYEKKIMDTRQAWTFDLGQVVRGVATSLAIAIVFGLVSLRDTSRDHTILLENNSREHESIERKFDKVMDRLNSIIERGYVYEG